MRNKYIVLIIACIISLAACKEKKADLVYTIEGNLQELASPYIYLVPFTSPDMPLDTITAKNGKFSYRNSSDSLQAILLYLQEKTIFITIWAKNNDRIKISGDVNYPELLTVEGGEVNDLLTGFKQQNKENIKKRQDLIEMLRANQKENLSTQSDNETYADILLLKQKIKDQALLFIEENPSSIASLVLLQDYVIDNETPVKVKTYLDMLTGEAKNNALYPFIDRIVTRLSESLVGNAAPFFSIINTDRDTITPDMFADHYFLLNFSLPGNDSCKHFTDELTAFLGKQPKTPLRALTVSLEEDNPAGRILRKNPSKHHLFAVDDNGWNAPIVSAYNITMITDNVLVGKDGRILARNIPVDSIKTLIDNNP